MLTRRALISSNLNDAQHGFVPRLTCLANLIITGELITSLAGQGEPVDLDFFFQNRLLINKMAVLWNRTIKSRSKTSLKVGQSKGISNYHFL